jgi:predicted MFS family arabinose efflux permease
MATQTLAGRSLESSLSYPGWRVGIASSACVFAGFASLLVYTFGVFLKPLAESFGWSRGSVSAAFGFAALSVAACSPGLGWLLDRFPARRIIIPCFTVFGVAFMLLSRLTPPIWHLYALFIALGIVGNGTAHLAFARVLSTWFFERRGLAFAILLGGGAFGAMVLPLVAQGLIDSAGWRNAFLYLGAMALVVGVTLGFSIRENRQHPQHETVHRSGASLGEGLRSRSFWIIIAVLFLVSVCQNGTIAHLSALLTDRGVTPDRAALAVSVLGGAVLVGRLATGALLDRFFAPRVAFVLLLLSAVGTAVLATASSLPVAIFGAALIGAGMGGEGDVTPYLLTRYFGLRAFSTLYGLSWTAYAIAGAVGPVLMGKVYDATGSYTRLLMVLAGVGVVAALLMVTLPKYRESSLALPADVGT